ncbi:hypothetical protein BN1002_00806 [Bacillus sp. B-jedd]|nr:hypothetical protein BN1002_00806 [Bacillus sp. B-jedd]
MYSNLTSDMNTAHKHSSRGNAGMALPKKEHLIGNSTVIVHSPLVEMTSAERANWFKEQWEEGHPVLKEIARAVEDCYRN